MAEKRNQPKQVKASTKPVCQIGTRMLLKRQDFQQLLAALLEKKYRIVGPVVQDGAIVLREGINSDEELPAGWGDEQGSGQYRLSKRTDTALFGYAAGPHSWKQFLHLPNVRLWRGRKNGKTFEELPEDSEPPRLALLGARACDLHAIAVQDKIFLGGTSVDPLYAQRRGQVFVVAVNCTQPGATCFCSSMKTGPKATLGFDLALTELQEEQRHFFVIEAGTEKGLEILRQLPVCEASAADVQQADQALAQAEKRMGRTLQTKGLKELLYRNYEHPRWDNVASRCLSCANCTMVCPTCFCSTVEDTTNLGSAHAERWRKWDSCFTMDFSYIHGGSVRASVKARYRQWMTHKLATWIDQFGTSGCVGCGRCITWCPVGIDITEEARAIRQSDGVT